MINLQAQIDGLEQLLARGRAAIGGLRGPRAPMPNQPLIYAAHGESGDAQRRSE